MLPQFFMKLKIFSPTLSIPFITAGMLFILMIFPKFVLAEKTIQQLGSLQLLIPKDIKVNIFAKDVHQARHMAFDDQGVLFLSQAKEGKVVALPDFDKIEYSPEGELYLSDDLLGVVYKISGN